MKYIWLTLVFTASTFLANGQDLVYTPRNPAFGGNTLNYSWLLNSATAQNGFQAESDGFDRDPEDPLDDFTESINRQILSQLTREVLSNQLEDDQLLQPGTFEFGSLQVNVVPGATGLVVTITDFSTGGQSQITVPFF